MTPTLLVIHHSHTDVGNTDPRAVVERWHAEYLARAVDLATPEAAHQRALALVHGARTVRQAGRA